MSGDQTGDPGGAAAPRVLRGWDIACVGFADWDQPLWTNQQHLMSRLAADNRVLFVESLGLRRPTISSRDLTRMGRRVLRAARGAWTHDGVAVLSPLVIPRHDVPALQRANRGLLALQVRRAARRLGFRRPLLWGYVPQAEALLAPLAPELVIYHCVDDIAAQRGVDGEAFQAAERRFAARADLVLASAPALAERMRALNPNVLYAPNVADTELFATALEPGPVDPALAALPRPRIVFTGAVVATKLDLELLAGLARSRPEWTIALVGPVGEGDPTTDVSALSALSNVALLGGRAYGELPAVLRGADAAMIPYAINRLTASIFPMKVNEYLAAGLPVVATPLPALAGVPDLAVAADAQAFAAALDAALAQDGPAARAERSARAAARSWTARIAEIDAALAPIVAAGPTSAGRP